MNNADISIIYEDDNLVAVNKPAGVSVHGGPGIREKTISDWLVAKYPEMKKVGDEPEIRPGIVHRLDKDTSGILLAVKNQRAFEFLKKQFQDKKVEKRYFALVCGILKNSEGVIDLPIGRSGKDFRRKTAKGELRGKIRTAVTKYKILKNFKEFTLAEVFPQTGRMHQIRVHMKAIGHPVACDKLYGGRRQSCPFGLKRQFLHASSLSLSLPSGSKIKFEAGLPEDLQRVLDMLN